MISLIIIIINIILFLIAFWQIKSLKNLNGEIAKNRIKLAQNDTTLATQEEHIKVLKNDINSIKNTKEEAKKDLESFKEYCAIEKDKGYQELNNYIENFNKSKNEVVDSYKQNLNYAYDNYLNTLEKKYDEAKEEYDFNIAEIHKTYSEAEAALKEIKSSLQAGIEARIREKEKEEQLEFYKLKVTKEELSDIEKIMDFKKYLHNPTIVSKIVWSTYFLRASNELCANLFCDKKVTGIYKITHIESGQCYIGQSVNVTDRLKQHIKCGLGIDAPSTNKLYNAMQELGVWNFTYELLEKCDKEQLNAKERFWIDFYNSEKFGYNNNKGVKNG